MCESHFLLYLVRYVFTSSKQRTDHTNTVSFLHSRVLSGKLLFPGFFSSSSSSLKKSSISSLDCSCVRKRGRKLLVRVRVLGTVDSRLSQHCYSASDNANLTFEF